MSTELSADGRTLRISGLEDHVSAEGVYDLSIDLTELLTLSGVPGSGSFSTTWVLDSQVPSSEILPLSGSQVIPSFVVSVAGADPNLASGRRGSGIDGYEIYVSTDGGPYEFYQRLTGRTSTMFVGQENTEYRFYSRAFDEAGNVELAPPGFDAFTEIGRLGPAVDETRIQAGLSSRSYVDNVSFKFDRGTNLPSLLNDETILDAVTLTGYGTNGTTIETHELSLDQFRVEVDPATGLGELTWSFDSYANGRDSLPDGYYVFELNPTLITDVAGFALDGDGDNSTGGDFQKSLHRLSGDADGNGVVDIADMSVVLASLGRTEGMDDFDPNADLDRDGRVTVRDRIVVARAFGNHISFPASFSTSSGESGKNLSTDRFDINKDGKLTVVDALTVINAIARQAAVRGSESQSSHPDVAEALDVNGDGRLSPIDALHVINQLSSNSGAPQQQSVADGEQTMYSLVDFDSRTLDEPDDQDELVRLLADDQINLFSLSH
ncbi:MAG: dockerin type I domain-containing protein [Planctomycetota bacterium]